MTVQPPAHTIDGFIKITIGAGFLLMAYGVIPTHPRDPEKAALWHRKFGTMMKICGCATILFGLLKVCGIM